MSDEPREPEHDPKPDPPHGLVEEIEHAVEQAVEHVPQQVRWTVRKLVLVSGLALVGLVVIACVSLVAYYANRTVIVAHELTLFVNGILATRSDVVLEIGDLKGNPFTGVRLIRPRVRFREGGGAPLLEAPSADLKYSAWGLLTGKTRSIELVLNRPEITLSRKADGVLRLPQWKSSGRVSTTRKETRVHVMIRDARVTGLTERIEGARPRRHGGDRAGDAGRGAGALLETRGLRHERCEARRERDLGRQRSHHDSKARERARDLAQTRRR